MRISHRSPSLIFLLLAALVWSQIPIPVHAQDSTRIVTSYDADGSFVMDRIQVHVHTTFTNADGSRSYTAEELAQLADPLFESDVLQGYTALVAIPAGAEVAIESISGSSVLIPGSPFQAAGVHAFNEAATLVGEPFWMREQWVVRLQFFPVRWDQGDAIMMVMDDITVQLMLTTPWPKPQPARPDPLFEPIYQHLLVNYNDGLYWRRPPPVQTDIAEGPAPVPPNSTWRLHIRPRSPGFQRITGADLRDAGIDLSGIDPRQLQLYWRSQPLPSEIIGEEDGSLDVGDSLIFYAAPWDFKYDNYDSYWLVPVDQPGTRVQTISPEPAGIPVSSFEETVRLEEQKLYYSDLPRTDQSDHWFWEIIRPSRAMTAEKEIHFNLAPMPEGPVRASLRMHGFSTGSGPIKIALWINDYQIAVFTVQDQSEITLDQDFPHFILHDGDNTSRLQVSKVDGSNNTLVLDWIELTYVRRLESTDDSLYFSINWPGPWLIQLQGFSQVPELWDVSDPRHPHRIDDGSINATGQGEYQFANASDDSLHYAAATFAAMNQPLLHWEPVQGADLRQTQQQADYLIITPADFLSSAQTLAAYRQQQGLRTEIVLLQDIYNQFNAGIADANAIRAFLSWALGSWQTPAPTYVLLLGDAHTDPRGYVTTQPVFVPADLRTKDPWLGEVADENALVAVVGDDPIPDMLVGRLPARSQSDVDRVISKIIAFESASPQESWTHAMLLVADNPDSAGDFYKLANAVLDQFQSLLKIRTYYLGQNYGSTEALRQALLSDWSRGALFVNYIGHGQPTAWAGEQILSSVDLPQLQNSGQPSILLAIASLTGVYYWPGSQSLQEQMLFLPDQRGVVSYVASTGFGIAAGNALINQGFLEAALYQKARDAGTATYLAKMHLYGQGYSYAEFLTELYTLFGDPALRMPIAPWTQTIYTPMLLHTRVSAQMQVDNPPLQ